PGDTNADPSERARAAARISALAQAARREASERGGNNRVRRPEPMERSEAVPGTAAAARPRSNSNPPLPPGDASRNRRSARPPAPGVTDDLRPRSKTPEATAAAAPPIDSKSNPIARVPAPPESGLVRRALDVDELEPDAAGSSSTKWIVVLVLVLGAAA